jgi:asparagine synthase (glutamine-hydrolysing)
MCGITGWVGYQHHLNDQRAILEAMTATMACRGPDAGGLWARGHAALGHRRLAVIDLEGGVQPMSVDGEGGAVALTYSGEVYNFTELRAELRGRGHTFRTTSDTEVVLRGYLEWGEEVAERLNGIYAFAVWDARQERLVLIRDRLGVKPLYYQPTSDGVLFGSEPKAILANPLASPVVDADGLRELFSCFVKTPGRAVWAGMREVKPGTVVSLDRTGLRERTYWRLQARPHTDDLSETVAHIRGLLEDTVRRQLISDVPRCILLSGGLDSSAVTALSARFLHEQGEQVRTFAVDFTGQADHFKAEPEAGIVARDAPFIADVASHLATNHHDIVLDHGALTDPELRRACVAARDLPVGLGDRDMSIYLLFRAVREHSTVALSGEAADEVFGGYPSFHQQGAVWADTFPWLSVFPLDSTALVDPGLLRDLDYDEHVVETYRQALAAVPHVEGEDAVERRMREVCHLHLINELPVLLDRKDRMSMAVGLEARVPFCDHRLVEYVFNIPWKLKSFDNREKSLLRAATQDLLPPSVTARKKSGYPAIYDPSYVSALQGQTHDLLATGHNALNLFDRAQVKAATVVEPMAITPSQRSGLERLLDMAAWFDLHRPTLKL